MRPDINKVYYLASPYSSALPWYGTNGDTFKAAIENIRHLQIQAIAAKLIHQDYILVEPIASCQFKQLHFGLKASYDYWQRRDRALIKVCDGIIIVMMDGWNKSIGVSDEIDYAKSLGKEVWFLTCNTDEPRFSKWEDTTKTVSTHELCDIPVDLGGC